MSSVHPPRNPWGLRPSLIAKCDIVYQYDTSHVHILYIALHPQVRMGL